MSKKKSTMTLKDFHGGSIPSDFPLPSAPGAAVRPTLDRQSVRSENRLRPNSSGSLRNFDDKTPFLANSAVIGRNFDEDERKPLDAPAAARRPVSDESFRAPPVVVRSDRVGNQQNQVNWSSYSARVVEGGQPQSTTRPLSAGGSGQNAWGDRKEVARVASPVPRFVQASALDQVSSGRWQTRGVPQQADVEVIRGCESPNRSYGGVGFGSEREFCENLLVRDVERGFSLEEGVRGGVKEISAVERVRSPVLLDGNERGAVLYTNDGRPAYPDTNYGGYEPQIPIELYERSKLKLLPRMKPLDVSEASAVDYNKQGVHLQPPADTSRPGPRGTFHGNASNVKPGLTSNEASYVKPASDSSEAGNRLVERPKLNLKPRSQPLDQSQRNTESGRMSLFGGARPREMVLKERGVDDVVGSHDHDELQSPNRIKSPVLRPEIAPTPANISRHGERTGNLPTDHKTGRGNERREQRAEVQKTDIQRKNWRNENWRNSRDNEKQQLQQERPPSPETWRKAEPPKPAKSDGSGLRFGKAVSAVELAQAFSKPASERRSADQFSGQRGRPGRSQIPFSRLTGPATRAQINGY